MKKWGIHVPHYAVVTSADELAKLGHANDWMKHTKLVAKAH
jgi:ATP-citrate lyase beta-subunit